MENMLEVGNVDPKENIEKQYQGEVITFEKVKEMQPELAQWLDRINRYGKIAKRAIFILRPDEGVKNHISVFLFTANHEYHISARPDQEDRRGYLGSYGNSRVRRAGEHWTRGSDLHDGFYTEATWNAILCDIVSYELVDQEALPVN